MAKMGFTPKKGHAYLGHFASNACLKAGHNTMPNPNAPLGQGGRFAALEQNLSKEKGVRDPGALAAWIGRRKLGASRFNSLAAKGR